MLSLRAVLPRAVILLGLLAAFAIASPSASQAASCLTDPSADAEDVVLPSRISNAIRRAERSVCKAEEHIDEGEYTKTAASLRSVRRNMYRADTSARRQMAAVVPDEDAEDAPDAEETTTGPDSVIAVLNLEHNIAVTVPGLFDANSMGVVDAATHALFRTLNARDRLLDAVIALDPEEAGADYADGIADTVDGYTDEVANFGEAIADDQLSPGGGRVMSKALAQVTATQAKVNLAFGGGE